jgi:hypothetical protein
MPMSARRRRYVLEVYQPSYRPDMSDERNGWKVRDLDELRAATLDWCRGITRESVSVKDGTRTYRFTTTSPKIAAMLGFSAEARA